MLEYQRQGQKQLLLGLTELGKTNENVVALCASLLEPLEVSTLV